MPTKYMIYDIESEELATTKLFDSYSEAAEWVDPRCTSYSIGPIKVPGYCGDDDEEESQ
jgi:hypothetical protein